MGQAYVIESNGYDAGKVQPGIKLIAALKALFVQHNHLRMVQFTWRKIINNKGSINN